MKTCRLRQQSACRIPVGERVSQPTQIDELDEDEIAEKLEEYGERLAKDVRSRHDKVYDVNEFAEKDKFLSDIQNDLELFDHILDELDRLKLVASDPKLAKLGEDLAQIMKTKDKPTEPARKVVIFSEYRDTVKYVEEYLEKKFPGQFISVKGDFTKSKATEIIGNFDTTYKNQSNKYQILLATDKMSEGFNLNRAGAVQHRFQAFTGIVELEFGLGSEILSYSYRGMLLLVRVDSYIQHLTNSMHPIAGCEVEGDTNRSEFPMSISADNAIELSKSIIAEFHRYFVAGDVDNYDHVMAIKRIITATCSHFPKDSMEVEKNLLDYALGLFEEEWLRLMKEDEDEYDRKEELGEARKVFLQLYKTEKNAW